MRSVLLFPLNTHWFIHYIRRKECDNKLKWCVFKPFSSYRDSYNLQVSASWYVFWLLQSDPAPKSIQFMRQAEHVWEKNLANYPQNVGLLFCFSSVFLDSVDNVANHWEDLWQCCIYWIFALMWWSVWFMLCVIHLINQTYVPSTFEQLLKNEGEKDFLFMLSSSNYKFTM